MRFLRQSLVGLFLASLTLALLVFAGQLVFSAIQTRMSDDSRPPPARERVFAVNIQVARLETITPSLKAFGAVQTIRSLELRAAQKGKVIELSPSFVEGGMVKAGEILVRIDPATAQAALDRVQSDVQDAQAEQRDAARSLDLARDEVEATRDQADLREQAFQRQKDLEARGVGTATAVEIAELAAASARQALLARRQALAEAEARVDKAATRLSRGLITLGDAQRDLADTQLVAPYDGSLSDVNLVEGRLVSLNEKLARLVDTSALEVAFRVSTAQYVRLLDANGALILAPVTVALDSTGADLRASGRIIRESFVVGDGQSGRLLFARLDAAPGFKPGDFVTVSVEEPPVHRVVRLPASALDAMGTVLVLGPEDRLEELPVELVRRQGDDVLVRGAGLDGREVITGRTPLLGAGIKVRPVRDEASVEPERVMLDLSDEHRAKLVAMVEANKKMPAEAKARALTLLSEPQVPAKLVERLESRAGG